MPGERDLAARCRYAHELGDMSARHGEANGARICVPQRLVKGELCRVEGAEDPVVEAPDLRLAHRFR